MSYQVLARKWRPQVFEDVVGQGHITKTLQNAISTNRLAHAFLFSGPRGVGKTTTARILAKALNCKNGPTPTPCGICDACTETAAGTSVDVIEIDGASNRGIEHIRELRETVKYAPVGGKYKVYVIDEVHMLTNEAFNALLKTLEEPPPRVIFIFATTEPQKVPATIHSRCQRYGFKRISLQEIASKLRQIAEREGITVSDRGLTMIARAAEGSMRDSQSLLDQAISSSGLTIKDEELQGILGAVAQESLVRLADGLLARDAAGLLKQVDALLEQGQDMRQLLAGVVEHVRNLIIVKVAEQSASIIEIAAGDLERIKQQAATTETERLIMLFDSLSRTLDELRWSPHQRFTLEIGLVKACNIAPLKPLAEVLDHLKHLEAGGVRIASGGASARPAPTTAHDRSAAYGHGAPKRPEQAAQHGLNVTTSSGKGVWPQVIAAVKQRKPGLATFLAGSGIIEQTGDAMVIGIQGAPFTLQQVEKQESRELIGQAVEEVSGTRTKLSFRLLTADKERAPQSKAAPAKKAPVEQDPLVNDALSIFNGEVVDPGEQSRG
ncbi:MAG: DNA polymerase III subunit gamma/tau [Nitrospirota bacterium]|nr:DNA polymerase III subunit gamma/tau [Nitrospirota bacterium]